MPTYGYDKKTDYQKLMNEAVKSGDYARAAIYEQQRNEKIKGEGLTQYQATNQYSAFLPGAQKFENPYRADLDAAIGRLQDKSAYEKAYLREADRTMEDTLAQYGTMTGGLPSTQAIAAASQAADYYKSQLPEKLADLDRQNASLLLSAGNQAQSEYQAMISQALSRWSQLGFADDHVSQILGVAPGTPTSDQSYINWQKGQQDKSDAYSMAMNLMQTGQMPSADVLAAAGISAADAQSYLDGQKKQQSDSNAYTIAMTLLQSGRMPSEDTLTAAGISMEDAQSLLAANTTPTYTGSSGGGDDTETGTKPLTEKLWNELYAAYVEGTARGDLSSFNSMTTNYSRTYDLMDFYAFLATLQGDEVGPEAPAGGYQSSKKPPEKGTLWKDYIN
ncbi:MAG: hypothetical protein J6K89_04060 [Oscillospiraceae bacterium]|nr:hypothetical protein [Oscillospiraceae bacterium]